MRRDHHPPLAVFNHPGTQPRAVTVTPGANSCLHGPFAWLGPRPGPHDGDGDRCRPTWVSPRRAGQLASHAHLEDGKLLGAVRVSVLCVLTGETSLRFPRQGRHPSSAGLLLRLVTACLASKSAGCKQWGKRFDPNGCKTLHVRPSHGSRAQPFRMLKKPR